uniref:Si:ch211-13f8.2 n=1 Tax=Sinocyclocheilus anshuiensis TaxID=1608454 RepID=A0A671LY50_9TELE
HLLQSICYSLQASGKLLFGLLLLEIWIGFIHTLIDLEPVLHQTCLLKPKVVIAALARNSEHSLPYFLGCIERLDYPKDRQNATMANFGPNMDFMYNNTDHNIDNTTAMLHEWLSGVEHLYHSLQLSHSIYFYNYYVDELGPKHWTESRFSHVMKLRQAALGQSTVGRLHPGETSSPSVLILGQLPMSVTTGCIIISYLPTIFKYVELLHGPFNSPKNFTIASAALAFYPVHHYYLWALDDIMAFAFSARQAGVQMFICNKEHYGYLPLPLNTKQTLEEVESFSHTVTEALSVCIFNLFQCNTRIFPFFKVYLINLKRREDRMLRSLELLGIDVTLIDAVDGKALNSAQLRALGIEMLPGYKDPNSDCVLTMGKKCSLFCFESSYGSITIASTKRSLVFACIPILFSLSYIRHKRLQIKHPEHWLEGVKNLVIPDYSYWTLGYAQPLSKMLPVDEFLQVMFNKHHNDTETSSIWDDETVATDWARHHIRGDRSRGAKSPTPISESSPRDEL